MRLPVRISVEEAERAGDVWGCNCGPGALAAIMGLTLDEVRPHMGDFERKGYTNPTLMFDALKSVGAKWKTTQIQHHSEISQPTSLLGLMKFPRYGLARIQWEGPWTRPGVPIVARYRQTHWVASQYGADGSLGIFDINCVGNGSGWTTFEAWRDIAVPWILEERVPRADGKWHITHSIEIETATISAPTAAEDAA
jgi:hypothetical protein